MKVVIVLTLTLTTLAGSLSPHILEETFYLYTRSNSDPDKILASNLKDLNNSHFQPGKPNFIIIPTYKQDYRSPINDDIRPTILQLKDANVFILDWTNVLSRTDDTIPKVGKKVANLVDYTLVNYAVSMSDFNFIGHGMGGYIAAYAGNFLQGNISTFVGLDPDELHSVKYSLKFNSSAKAIIIHTSTMGVKNKVGNVDIYINGGINQSGCGITCLHSRAYEYYGQAIGNNSISATRCDSYANFVGRTCDANPKISLRTLLLEGVPQGSYYLNMTSDKKYITQIANQAVCATGGILGILGISICANVQ